ncbi:MAG: biliverdin-producing heme oxygenase [Nitrosospira sp.]
MPGSLRDELRSSTRLQHDAIENTLNIMRIDVTMADYVAYLCCYYGYYRALEYRLIAGDSSYCNNALKLNARQKLERLAADINRLCGTKSLARIPICPYPPTITEATDVVGCSYVIEGSTLGAMIMYRHLHKCLGVSSNNGASFVYGYGESTTIQWKRFVEAIEAMDFDAAERKKCVEAAVATFDTMKVWLTTAHEAQKVAITWRRGSHSIFSRI